MAELIPAFAVERARVGTASLRQHQLHELEPGRAWAVAMALGPPRLWADLLERTLAAFVEGYERPHDGRASTQLHQGLRAAQAGLRVRVEALIERRLPDVGLLAFALEDIGARAQNQALASAREQDQDQAPASAGEQDEARASAREQGQVLHVLGAGPLRAYVARGKVLRRLDAKEDSADGLLRGATSRCAEPLEPGDLAFVGSLSACSEPALRALQSALAGDRRFPPEQVVRLLNGPPAELGIGAVTLAFRAPATGP